jgi:hypothetical protein
MLKLYFIIAFIYAALKTVNSNEQKATGIIGFFLTKFFLFPLGALKDIVAAFGGKN